MLDATTEKTAWDSCFRRPAASDVPPFMVMDVMAAAERIEAAGRATSSTWRWASRPRPAPRAALAAAHRAPRRRADRLYLRAWHAPRCANASRGIIATVTVCARRCRTNRGDDGLLGRLHPGVSRHVSSPATRVAVTVPSYPPVPSHPDRASAASPLLIETTSETRHAFDRRGPPEARHRKTPLQGVAGRKPGQSDRKP